MTTTSFGTLLQTLITIATTDALKVELPIISAFLANISNNTSSINIVAQLTALLVEVEASLPTVEQDIVKDVTAILQQEVNALANPPAAA
jgi:hypothetical protein